MGDSTGLTLGSTSTYINIKYIQVWEEGGSLGGQEAEGLELFADKLE